MIPRDTAEFFKLKNAIDDQVARLGWSKERCMVYTKERYGVRSRLSMTDGQLRHLLQVLTNMSTPQTSTKPSTQADRRRKRKRI
jgi:hypothetical protein